jgi:hypothetical protein
MNIYHIIQYFFLGLEIAFAIDGNAAWIPCAIASLAFAVPNIAPLFRQPMRHG